MIYLILLAWIQTFLKNLFLVISKICYHFIVIYLSSSISALGTLALYHCAVEITSQNLTCSDHTEAQPNFYALRFPSLHATFLLQERLALLMEDDSVDGFIGEILDSEERVSISRSVADAGWEKRSISWFGELAMVCGTFCMRDTIPSHSRHARFDG